MGSCNQCVLRQEPQHQLMTQNFPVNLIKYNLKLVIRIQAAYRAYICRKHFKKELAQKRSMNQKRSNSTDDCFIEHRTISYSPKINVQDNQNVFSLLENNGKRKSLSHFGRQHTAQLQPKKSDSFEDEDESYVENQLLKSVSSPPIKSMRSSQNQSKKMQSFKIRCVLTSEVLEPKDKIKIQSTNNKRMKIETIKLVGGNVYSGEWLDQLPDGKGRYIFSDQSHYQGEFVKGCLHGKGELKSKDGSSYRGQWQNNRMQGQGIYVYANGSKYEGQWERDMPNGDGIEWYVNGSVYVGKFVNGEKHGRGKLTFVSGEVYEGDFEFDNFNGQGIYRWLDGRVYAGNWVDGKMNGYGKLTWPDGRFYEGEYSNDQKNGFGVFQFADGRKYVGQWKEGLQHGQGEFCKGELTTKGIWRKGQLVKLL